MDHAEIHSIVANNVANVTFTKKDGTERIMRCTIIEDMIPEERKPKGTGVQYSNDVIRVFDLDIGEWRSFRIDSVISIEVNEE